MTSKHHRVRLARAAAVCAVAVTGALSFASTASAANLSTSVSTEAQLESAINAINGDTSGTTQTITLAAGTYTPAPVAPATTTPLVITTNDPVIFQGPTPVPNQIGSPATISGSSPALGGNAVLVVSPGSTVTVKDVVFQQAGSASNPGPAIDDQGTLNTLDAGFAGNNGAGAVFVESGSIGNFTESTFEGNNGSSGVLDQGTATFTNSTVALNKSGDGLFLQGGNATLINTIVAKNKTDCVESQGGTVSSATTSIDGDGTCGLTGTGNQSSADSTIDLVANGSSSYGGVTPSVPPLPGSTAIGAGTDSFCTTAGTDQRGYAYSGTTCNIGSVQTSTTAPTFTQAPITAAIQPPATSVAVTYPAAVSTTDWTDAAFPIHTSTFTASAASPATLSTNTGATFTAGTTPVSVTIQDYYGNSGTGTFNVIGATSTAPTVTITPAGGGANSNATVTGTSSAGASLAFAATATDVPDGTITPTCKVVSGTTTTNNVTSPYTFPFGTSTLSCTATNSTNSALTTTQSITVTVNDPAPTVTVPASFSVFGAAGSSVTVTFSATATDLKDGTDAVTCTPIASGSSITMPSTTTTVTDSCTAENSQGQTSAPATFVITETPGLPTSVQGDVEGHVQCTEGLTQPPVVTTPPPAAVSPLLPGGPTDDIADFGYFQVGVTQGYTATATTNVTDTCSAATLNINDTDSSATFAGHLLSDNPVVQPSTGHTNPAGYEIAGALQAAATSSNPYATPGALISVSHTPTGILSYSGPVTADPVTVNFAQQITSGQVLVHGDYSEQVLLSISTTP